MAVVAPLDAHLLATDCAAVLTRSQREPVHTKTETFIVVLPGRCLPSLRATACHCTTGPISNHTIATCIHLGFQSWPALVAPGTRVNRFVSEATTGPRSVHANMSPGFPFTTGICEAQ